MYSWDRCEVPRTDTSHPNMGVPSGSSCYVVSVDPCIALTNKRMNGDESRRWGAAHSSGPSRVLPAVCVFSLALVPSIVIPTALPSGDVAVPFFLQVLSPLLHSVHLLKAKLVFLRGASDVSLGVSPLSTHPGATSSVVLKLIARKAE